MECSQKSVWDCKNDFENDGTEIIINDGKAIVKRDESGVENGEN